MLREAAVVEVVRAEELIIGFAVGHWWQGRLAEGAGLFALFAGAIWLPFRRGEED